MVLVERGENVNATFEMEEDEMIANGDGQGSLTWLLSNI